MKDSIDADTLEHLLARVTLRDQAALEQLYKFVAPKLTGVAMKIVHDSDLANDILQETFLQIWDNAGDYRRDQSEPMTWMTSLLRYRTLDKLKSEKREQHRRNQFHEAHNLFCEPESTSPLTNMLQDDADIQVSTCLQTLDVLQRNSILMAYYFGYSRAEIAVHIEKPINTIKSWLKRGLTRLAQCLSH